MVHPFESADRAAFVARWKVTGPILAAHSLAELRSMSLQQRQLQIDNLLNLGFQFRRNRIDDGPVRLQQALRRMDQNSSRSS